MNAIRRFRASLLLGMAVGVALAWLASSQQTSKTAESSIDLNAYYAMKDVEVSDPFDLEAYFTDQQDEFYPLLPPAADFILRQPGMPDVLPFDPAAFPDEFLKGLIEEYEFSAPVYYVELIEDPITRATLFVNRDGYEIYRLDPPSAYDPFALLKAKYPRLYSGAYSTDVVKEYEAMYDPARIRIRVRLLPSDYVEPYLYAKAKVEAYEWAMMEEDDQGGGMMMLMGESESNIVISAISKLANG